eukprot:Amastigsp_a841229_1799.p1 type:complete len:211 gc:universal Amastigsp_a841229_1799:672-40(-)
MAAGMAQRLLMKQFKDIASSPIDGANVNLIGEDIFHWEVYMAGPPDSACENGVFRAVFKFPADFPYSPPTMQFTTPMWHPNVYPDGRVCISILHPAVDEFGSGESLNERWLPSRSIESIIVSVLSMLAEPNINSPANVDASVQFRDRTAEYNARVREICERSIRELPPNVVRPRFPKPVAIELHRQETQESQGSEANWYCENSDDEEAMS